MKFSGISAALIAAGLVFGANAAQAQETDEQLLSFVAGYKATFTCSGVFNAGADPADLAEHELRGIRALYAPLLPSLPDAVIDHENKTVSVSYADDRAPRVAAWRPYLGCAQLPMNVAAEDADMLGGVSLPARDLSGASAAWPNGDTTEVDTSARLQAVIDAAFDMQTYGEGAETSAVVVTTPDQILGEKYLEGYDLRRPQRTWSVAKSIAATVVGIAVHEGTLDVGAPAPVPQWQRDGDPRGEITLGNLLNMASGLYSGPAGNYTPYVYWGGSRVDDVTTGRAVEVAPGSRWKYANNDTMLAIRALRGAIDDDQAYRNYPFEKLINKVGMRDTYLETDWDGNFIMSSQVWTTARDLARLGILYLNQGVWNGERLFGEDWAGYVATPSKVEPAGGDWGYGAQFWLYNRGGNDLPADTYAARGNRGQIIMIIPSKKLVVVRRGYDTATGNRFDIAEFTLDVLKAIEE